MRIEPPTDIELWRFLADKELEKEIGNPYQEYVDWLEYDLENCNGDEEDKIELKADIRFLEWLGDGNNNVGIKLRFGKMSENSKDDLAIRKLEANHYFYVSYYGDETFDFKSYSGDGDCSLRTAMDKAGFSSSESPSLYREWKRATRREIYKRDPEKVLESTRRYKKKHRDRVNAKRREYKREYRRKNRELVNEKNRLYRNNNRERILEMQGEWRRKNQEKIKKYNREYRLRNKEKKLRCLKKEAKKLDEA